MSLFGGKKSEIYALFDISSSSVGAALVCVSEKALPTVHYSVRLRIEFQGEGATGMLRTLDDVVRKLTTEGGPTLRKAGVPHETSISFVHMSAPWQSSILQTHTVEKEKPFPFTEALQTEALADCAAQGGQSVVVATLLNGYQTAKPIGKKATRTDIIVLCSKIEASIATAVRKAIRGSMGKDSLRFLPFSVVAPHALLSAFPHEHDFLALHISGGASDLVFVKQGLLAGAAATDAGADTFKKAARGSGVSSLAAVSESEHGIIDKERNAKLSTRLEEAKAEWFAKMHEALTTLAAGSALPRVLYLFAEPENLSFFQGLLNASEIHGLWLSDEPLTVVPVSVNDFEHFVLQSEGQVSDPMLDALSFAIPTH